MKNTLLFLVYMMLIASIGWSCDDNLDIKQNYKYSIETLPLPQSLAPGETIDLEFSIICEGYYKEATYKFRYFQSEGTGILKDDEGKSIPMNRFQSIVSDEFVLTYTNKAEEQTQLDFVFEDSFGQKVEYEIVFTGKRTEKE